MTFSQLLNEIADTYRDESRAFHVLATRYYIGAESRESLKRGPLTSAQVAAIIKNR